MSWQDKLREFYIERFFEMVNEFLPQEDDINYSQGRQEAVSKVSLSKEEIKIAVDYLREVWPDIDDFISYNNFPSQ